MSTDLPLLAWVTLQANKANHTDFILADTVDARIHAAHLVTAGFSCTGVRRRARCWPGLTEIAL